MKDKIFGALTYGGFMLIAVGCILPFFLGPQAVAYKIVYAIGAALMLTGRILTPNPATDLRVRRLIRLQTWSTLFFAVAAFFMWYSNDPRDWLVFTLSGAMVQCYVSLMLPRAMRNAAKNKSK